MNVKPLSPVMKRAIANALANGNREVHCTDATWHALRERGLARHGKLKTEIRDSRRHLVRTHGVILTPLGVKVAEAVRREADGGPKVTPTRIRAIREELEAQAHKPAPAPVASNAFEQGAMGLLAQEPEQAQNTYFLRVCENTAEECERGQCRLTSTRAQGTLDEVRAAAAMFRHSWAVSLAGDEITMTRPAPAPAPQTRPWAVKGVRVSVPLGKATLTGVRDTVKGLNGEPVEMIELTMDEGGATFSITADSPHLYRLCTECDTAGDEPEDREREVCGYCLAKRDDEKAAQVAEIVKAAMKCDQADKVLDAAMDESRSARDFGRAVVYRAYGMHDHEAERVDWAAVRTALVNAWEKATQPA